MTRDPQTVSEVHAAIIAVTLQKRSARTKADRRAADARLSELLKIRDAIRHASA